MRRRGALAALFLLLAVLGALFAPWLSPAPPDAQDLDRRLASPSPGHPLGTDELGRDVLARVLYGARASLTVALAVVVLAGSLGTLLGATAGYAGGVWDRMVGIASDACLAFPGMLLAIALVAALGPALRYVVLALVSLGWVGYARLVRAQVMRLREEEFVLAARALGASPARVLVRHVLPNVLPALLVQASASMAGAILAESSLSFLGLGLQPPTPSWGAMVDAGRAHLLDAPHVAVFPGLALSLTVLALNFAGDALADRLDPRAARAFAAGAP
ncbi:MAG: ABC transporter permease [Acidobacteriota bacterium]